MSKTLEQLKTELFDTLGKHAPTVSVWLTDIQDSYKAVMMYAKIADVWMKINELDQTGKGEDGFNITVEVDSDQGKELLTKLLEDGADND